MRLICQHVLWILVFLDLSQLEKQSAIWACYDFMLEIVSYFLVDFLSSCLPLLLLFESWKLYNCLDHWVIVDLTLRLFLQQCQSSVILQLLHRCRKLARMKLFSRSITHSQLLLNVSFNIHIVFHRRKIFDCSDITIFLFRIWVRIYLIHNMPVLPRKAFSFVRYLLFLRNVQIKYNDSVLHGHLNEVHFLLFSLHFFEFARIMDQ